MPQQRAVDADAPLRTHSRGHRLGQQDPQITDAARADEHPVTRAPGSPSRPEESTIVSTHDWTRAMESHAFPLAHSTGRSAVQHSIHPAPARSGARTSATSPKDPPTLHCTAAQRQVGARGTSYADHRCARRHGRGHAGGGLSTSRGPGGHGRYRLRRPRSAALSVRVTGPRQSASHGPPRSPPGRPRHPSVPRSATPASRSDGRPRVVDVTAAPGWKPAEVLRLAATVDQYSPHVPGPLHRRRGP